MGFRAKKNKRWPNGVIVYRFKDIAEQRQKLFRDCMDTWEACVNAKAGKTLIQFKQSDGSESTYLRIRTMPGRANSGSIALTNVRDDGSIWFDLGDEHLAAIPHELAHSIGVAHEHEQNSPKNAANWTNEEDPHLCFAGGGFWIDTYVAQATKYDVVGAYDRKSITHYPSGDVWKWKPDSFKPSKADELKLINYPTKQQVEQQVWRPSAGDIATIIDLYT